MTVDVALLPADLSRRELTGQTVVVLDVLRATTSMTAALQAGVDEIQVFADVGSARRAADGRAQPPLLCGEQNCLRPEGFDLGNSPTSFGSALAGRTLYMATTNGTRAIIAAEGAKLVLVGALVNARAVARFVSEAGQDLVLLCAGTGGSIAMEDAIGAGAVLEELQRAVSVQLASDAARMALGLFRASRNDLGAALADAQGGRNLIQVGLGEDIEFAARLSSMDIVGAVSPFPTRIRAVRGFPAAIFDSKIG